MDMAEWWARLGSMAQRTENMRGLRGAVNCFARRLIDADSFIWRIPAFPAKGLEPEFLTAHRAAEINPCPLAESAMASSF
jgi:hypothetical protein